MNIEKESFVWVMPILTVSRLNFENCFQGMEVWKRMAPFLAFIPDSTIKTL